MEKMPNFRFKLLVLGEWGVGKTSLVRSFVEKKFTADYLPSIGVNILIKDLDLNLNDQIIKVALSIWDIAGKGIQTARTNLPLWSLLEHSS